TAADGSPIAEMVVTNGKVVITFNDYLELHENVQFNGFLKARVSAVVEPDTDYDLQWPVGGEVFVTPVTTVPCAGCEPADLTASKFATYVAGPPPYVRFAITTAAAQSVGEQITITDVVGAGQEISCANVAMQVGDSVDAWGNVEWDGPWKAFTVDTCDATTLTVSLTSTATGQFFRLNGRAYTTELRESYTDSGRVTQAGETDRVNATAEMTDGGADVIGNKRVPKIDIEKWSTNEGMTTGDHDDSAKLLDPDKAEAITFTVVNNGREALKEIVVGDRTTAGTGTLTNLVCSFPDGSSGTTWAGPLPIGASFTCTGKLPALGPGATHTDLASVTAIGRRTRVVVKDSDPWMAETPAQSKPAVDIEKWSTVDGPRAGDHDRSPKQIKAGTEQSITFTITNSGDEALKDIRVRDEVVSGGGRIEGLSCDFSALGGPATGTRWVGPFEVGASFECLGTLTGLEPGQTHRDRASVVGTGVDSGTTVTDHDDWNAEAPELQPTAAPPVLPNTGLGTGLLPLATAGLLMLGAGLWLRRRSIG
ncbi:MAG: LPXTG cell wall anchor domain-containing protein, partial [Nocardioides sp.]